MSILDQIASGGTPPVNPLDTLGKLQSLRTGQMQQQGLALENQTRGLQVQQQQQAMKDQQAVTSAYQQWKPEDGYDALAHLTVQNGGSGNAAMAIQKHALDYAKGISEKAKMDAETGSKNIESMIAQHNIVAGKIANLQNVPDDQLGQAINATAQELSSTKGFDGKPLIDPQHTQTAAQIAQMPPQQARAALAILQKDYMGQTQQMAAAKEQADIELKRAETREKGTMVPVDEAAAKVLNVPVGSLQPLAVVQKARETANVGMENVTSNGRVQLLSKIDPKMPARDLGTAPSVTTFNLQNAVPKGEGGQPSQLAQMVANGQMKWTDAVSARWPLGTKAAFAAEVKSINPNFNSGDFTVEQKVREKYTSGNVSDQLRAIGTAREHMKLFGQLADALDNGNVQAANQIGNAFGVQFGNDAATNFKIASQAFGGEVGKALDGASVTAGEREQAAKSFNENMSPQQFRGAVHTVDGLLAGKQKSAQDAFDKESKGKPNFGNASGGHVIQVGSKKYQYKGTGATDDLSNYTEIGK